MDAVITMESQMQIPVAHRLVNEGTLQEVLLSGKEAVHLLVDGEAALGIAGQNLAGNDREQVYARSTFLRLTYSVSLYPISSSCMP